MISINPGLPAIAWSWLPAEKTNLITGNHYLVVEINKQNHTIESFWVGIAGIGCWFFPNEGCTVEFSRFHENDSHVTLIHPVPPLKLNTLEELQ
jgi:hypothetical protein